MVSRDNFIVSLSRMLGLEGGDAIYSSKVRISSITMHTYAYTYIHTNARM